MKLDQIENSTYQTLDPPSSSALPPINPFKRTIDTDKKPSEHKKRVEGRQEYVEPRQLAFGERRGSSPLN
jgi:hypothetical protein